MPSRARGAWRARAASPPDAGGPRRASPSRARKGRTRSPLEPGCYTRCVPRLFPFEALVYDPAVAGSLELVTAPPYDVISDARRREHLSSSPFSVVHLDLAEGSSDPDDPGSRYARAA